jgi:hypothetical protein
MGSDAPHKYECDVLMVDLNSLSAKELKAALDCCGLDLDSLEKDVREAAAVDCCVSYGTYAPLDSVSGDHRPLNIRAKARRIADELMSDSDILDDRLDRPVNAIGTTAREFGSGNILAGLERYAQKVADTGESPDAGNNLMLKIYGVDVEELKKPPVVKKIRRKDLTAECWLVQMHGTSQCKDCEAFGGSDCGGKEILRTGYNENGVKVGKKGLEP